MANGDVVTQSRQLLHVTLIDAETSTTDNGEWIDTGHFDSGSLHVIISATATVQMRGSCEPTKPANSSHGYQIGSDITATGGYAVERLPRWFKARVSSFGSGQVDVHACLRPTGLGV